MTKFPQKINFITSWRVVFWLTLSLLLLFSVTPRGYAMAADAVSTTPTTFPYKKTFIISGYYSPLPDQSRYFKGSFEADKRLNGNGTNGADGTPVFDGMLAGPSPYPFGTKIEVPGIGIFGLHDRGGAIRGNRLDIWLGRGEEGLRRALGWGMRTVEVTVYGVDNSIKEHVDFSSIPLMNLAAIAPRTNYFFDDLAIGEQGDSVRELQRFLKKFGYLTEEPTGNFGEATRLAVQKFQLEKNIIDSVNDSGAGNFGPRTRFALEAAAARAMDAELKTIPEGDLKLGDSGDTVLKLQNVLVKYGSLKTASGIFDEATKEALIVFQKSQGLMTSESDTGAGFYGQKTKAALEKVIVLNMTPSIPVRQAAPVVIAATKASTNIAAVPASPTLQKYFNRQVALNDSGAEVTKIQIELQKLNFLGVKSTGVFDKTTSHAVFKLQQAFGIVKNEKDSGAGVIGPRTLDMFNKIASSRDMQNMLVAQATSRYVPRVTTAVTDVIGASLSSTTQSVSSGAVSSGGGGGGSVSSAVATAMAVGAAVSAASTPVPVSPTTPVAVSTTPSSPAVVTPVAVTTVASTSAAAASQSSSALVLPTTLVAVAGSNSGGGSSGGSAPTMSAVISPGSSSSISSSGGGGAPLSVLNTTFVAQKTFITPLALNDKGDSVKKLQEELKNLSFYNAPITGNFGKTTQHAVIKLQQAFRIVKDEKDSGAGTMGTKTMDLLNTFVSNRAMQKQMIASAAQSNEIIAKRLEAERQLIAATAVTEQFAANLAAGVRNTDVVKLQSVLKQLGFFTGKITTEYFGDTTKNSLIAFQKSHGLEASGSLDERTRKVLNRLIPASQPS